MFRNPSAKLRPRDVPLDELAALLAPTSLKISRDADALIARHDHYTTRVEVVPPADCESENGPIRAVVRVVTELPSTVASLFRDRPADSAAAFNTYAALGAVCTHGDAIIVGSRLTIYEEEDAWRGLHLPLLMLSTIGAVEALLGGMRRTMSGEDIRHDTSDWTERDFGLAKRMLSRLCVCTTGGLGLTAEFSLSADSVSAAVGSPDTALFQLEAEAPHPELGGGLLCLLQMPHRVPDEALLRQICHQLNGMEMAAHDLPPHFGAWCPAQRGNGPAYVSFLPNALHAASGIAVNVAIWACNRARWANAMLASMGM